MVGIVLVSHSSEIASGLAELAGQMAGDGVVVLGDLGSAILTIRHVLERSGNGHVRLVDAPFVEGAVAAAVTASAGSSLDDVARAAEEARGVKKL